MKAEGSDPVKMLSYLSILESMCIGVFRKVLCITKLVFVS